MLAGPNGAGKSTYHDVFLADSPLMFVNADHFAAETGLDPLEAARVLDANRGRMVEDGLGFITETVLSDPYGYKLGLLRRATAAGFDVRLVYIGVDSTELLQQRIDQRVAVGGHEVPRDRVTPRFKRSLANLREAITFVTTVDLYDNSSAIAPFTLVASFRSGTLTWRANGRLPKWARGILRQR